MPQFIRHDAPAHDVSFIAISIASWLGTMGMAKYLTSGSSPLHVATYDYKNAFTLNDDSEFSLRTLVA